jgi:6-phosphogluconate dehydrogenase (decarboxylating)
MQLAMIGLGRMGGNMEPRLLRASRDLMAEELRWTATRR